MTRITLKIAFLKVFPRGYNRLLFFKKTEKVFSQIIEINWLGQENDERAEDSIIKDTRNLIRQKKELKEMDGTVI